MSVHDHEHSAAVSQRVKQLVATLERRGVTTETELDTMVRVETGPPPPY